VGREGGGGGGGGKDCCNPQRNMPCGSGKYLENATVKD